MADAHIEPPAWTRHELRNGERYTGPVDVVLADVGFEPGREPGPAAPRRAAQAERPTCPVPGPLVLTAS